MSAAGWSELKREFGRKVFHMLTVVYWALFALAGWPRAAWLLAAWLAVVLVIETVRLKVPAAERFLVGLFEGMIRETERRHFSGIVHTTAGSLAAMLIAQGQPAIVGTAIGQLAFGDAAAALVGKSCGRVKLLGGKKSLEGCLAGFATNAAVALAFGLAPLPAFASALAASATELLPTTGWFNDNLWMPAASALTLRLLL